MMGFWMLDSRYRILDTGFWILNVWLTNYRFDFLLIIFCIVVLMQDACVPDWVAWHAAYDDPSSSLTARLQRVRSHLWDAIGRAPAGRVSLVSLCAG